MWTDRMLALVRAHPRWILLLLLLLLILPTAWGVLGRGREGPADGESPPPGALVYLRTGCALCHGMRGEGTEGAPPVRGVGADALARFVRAPLRAMPAYPPSLLPDEDLAALAEALALLEPREERTPLGRRRAAQEALLVLAALVRGDAERARRGLLLLSRTPGTSLRAREALEALEGKGPAAALAAAEALLADTDPTADLGALYERLAVQAALRGRRAEAELALTRSLALSGPLFRERRARALEAVRRGDLSPLLTPALLPPTRLP